MKRCFVCIAGVFAVMALSAVPAFSQDPQTAAVETSDKADEISIYGEVQAVNIQAPSISVQYYDYDNDEEKTLEVSLDKDSRLENVQVIDEMKKGDWVDVTYIAVDGKNMAKMVSVEVEEPAEGNDSPMDAAEE